MPIWQLCANLLIPNCLRSNLSCSPLAALELYVNFEKHKIFLYKEDFEKFMNGLQQAIDFIGHEQGTTSETHYQPATTTEEIPSQSEEIKIDIDF